jgi:hypothetical protein
MVHRYINFLLVFKFDLTAIKKKIAIIVCVVFCQALK